MAKGDWIRKAIVINLVIGYLGGVYKGYGKGNSNKVVYSSGHSHLFTIAKENILGVYFNFLFVLCCHLQTAGIWTFINQHQVFFLVNLDELILNHLNENVEWIKIPLLNGRQFINSFFVFVFYFCFLLRSNSRTLSSTVVVLPLTFIPWLSKIHPSLSIYWDTFLNYQYSFFFFKLCINGIQMNLRKK